ncbi:MAG: fumarylacetoacetate hydrolase family protein [Elusimicrobia bacterium]|nr:fumarylacetoacetate hydrolase family protein [Elusimicrobiota bacterium]MDE2236808.1 fumarylacetoacetate hydrolase family protein [Elusimicrobiota bacterium]MDE2424707.1 fumarylacetoacetate hydrolase family protein [Elusimicrobiota bacterium]
MKLVTFEVSTPLGPFERLGALLEGGMVDLNFACAARLAAQGKAAPRRLADALLPAEMLAFLDGGSEALEAAREALEDVRRGRLEAGSRGERLVYKEDEARLLAPLPRPRALRDFFAFEEHALQGAKRRGEPLAPQWYDQPVYYKGNHREIYGPGDTVPWPSYTRRFDFEFEIGCVVGKKGRDLSVEQAARHIAGYTILNDFSARDIQKSEMVCRMGPAKGKDFATGLGPYLLTADELPEPEGLKMTLKVNGEPWSESSSTGRRWSFPLMLSHVSQEETVYPGDLLGSGTYYKGCGLDLERWVKPGDVLELTVERLGTLRQVVGAPKAQRRLLYSGPH